MHPSPPSPRGSQSLAAVRTPLASPTSTSSSYGAWSRLSRDTGGTDSDISLQPLLSRGRGGGTGGDIEEDDTVQAADYGGPSTGEAAGETSRTAEGPLRFAEADAGASAESRPWLMRLASRTSGLQEESRPGELSQRTTFSNVDVGK